MLNQIPAASFIEATKDIEKRTPKDILARDTRRCTKELHESNILDMPATPYKTGYIAGFVFGLRVAQFMMQFTPNHNAAQRDPTDDPVIPAAETDPARFTSNGPVIEVPKVGAR